MAAFDEHAYNEASPRPGWIRGHVVAHLAWQRRRSQQPRAKGPHWTPSPRCAPHPKRVSPPSKPERPAYQSPAALVRRIRAQPGRGDGSPHGRQLARRGRHRARTNCPRRRDRVDAQPRSHGPRRDLGTTVGFGELADTFLQALQCDTEAKRGPGNVPHVVGERPPSSRLPCRTAAPESDTCRRFHPSTASALAVDTTERLPPHGVTQETPAADRLRDVAMLNKLAVPASEPHGSWAGES
jgi:hypothetical protein